jgi:transposase InsO family protein
MHANARLTPRGREVLVGRIEAGRPVGLVAAEMGISQTTAYRWWGRYRREGVAGLVDRSSRPLGSPRRTSAALEACIVEARRRLRWGPARLGPALGVPASTVYRVLCRHGLERLAFMDRPTGRVIRRYERARPGELVHVDVKKLGRIPPGGGWRAHGRQACPDRRRQIGWQYLHAAVDDHTRLAYAELLDDERSASCAAFLERAIDWFAGHGVRIEGVLTDNAFAYRLGRPWHATLATHQISQRFCRPYHPQTNGKVERFNRTLCEEWAYAQIYESDHQRQHALTAWLDHYNTTRAHTALGGQPPISRLNNLSAQYI